MLESEILRRARPETAIFRLRIPYANARAARAIALARARFRVVEERDEGDALFLEVTGEKRQLGTLREFLVEAGPGEASDDGLKTKGGACRLPPMPELPLRHSS